MKKVLGVTLIAVTVGSATADPADAQIMQTFCNSPAQTWCFNATALDFVESASSLVAGQSDFLVSLTGVWSGPAFSGGDNGWNFFLFLPGWASADSQLVPFLPGQPSTATMSAFAANPGWVAHRRREETLA